MKSVQVQSCNFHRTRGGDLEQGIAIGEVDVIIDQYGKIVPAVWDYTLTPYKGCMWVELGVLMINKVKAIKPK